MGTKKECIRYGPYPKVWRRLSCHWRPNGRTGQDHQYHGFNHGAPGNVITLFGPQGMLQRSLRSEEVRSHISMNWDDQNFINKAFRSAVSKAKVYTYNSKKHPSDNPKEAYMFHQAWCH